MKEANYPQMRDSIRRTPFKSRKLSIDNNAFEASQTKEDYNNHLRLLEITDNYNQRVGGCANSSLNGSFFKKKQYNAEHPRYPKRRNQSCHNSSENTSKYHSRLHSTDISTTPVNKNEGKSLKSNLEEKRMKITLVRNKIKANEEELNKCNIELNQLQAKRDQTENSLPNKLSEKESYEEIYRYNINKYSKSSNTKGRYCPMPLMSPCSMDNISVSKYEISILTPNEFKDAVISIINDLFINSKFEVIYQNLIEKELIKAYTSLSSNVGLGRGDIFFVKLTQGICGIYPTLNFDALIVLLKNTVKLNYIESMISKDLLFLQKEYKKKEKQLNQKIQELNNNEIKLECYLNELRENEIELMTQIDIIPDSSDKTTVNTSNIQRESIKKRSFHYEDDENEESFDNKVGYKEPSNNLLSNLISTQKKSDNNQQDDNNHFEITKKMIDYTNKYEDGESKSIFHRSCSNNRSPLIKNDLSTSWISDDKMKHLNIKESPIIHKIQHQRTNSVVKVPKRNLANITTNLDEKDNYIHSTYVQESMKSLIKNRSGNNLFNEEETEKPFIFSLSNNETNLTKTYCYYKFLNKSDPKYYPLHPQANNPDSLGYEKGLISYDYNNEMLCIKSMINKAKRHNIKSSSIQSTIIMNRMKDIIKIYTTYQEALQNAYNQPIDINYFIQQNEFDSIDLSDNDRIRATLCSSFSFIILLNSNEKIELLFVNYNEFKVWLDGLSSMFNKPKE